MTIKTQKRQSLSQKEQKREKTKSFLFLLYGSTLLSTDGRDRSVRSSHFNVLVKYNSFWYVFCFDIYKDTEMKLCYFILLSFVIHLHKQKR